jgi:hypothetical protein
MNKEFDELAKGLAQPATRRQAMKKFGVGLAGLALACFGLANKAKAGPKTCLPAGLPAGSTCMVGHQCCSKVCHKSRAYNTGYCG